MTPPLDLVLWLASCFGLGCITGTVLHFFIQKRRAKNAASGSHLEEQIT
jgi:hypothetical protein